MAITTITATDLLERHQSKGVQLIDVRTPIEFREQHAQIATNVPLARIDPKQLMESRNGNANQPLYIICRTGSRGLKACESIAAAGYENVVNVEGGLQAWEAAGLPVHRGKNTVSLERQVRIVAGLLVFIGAVLGYFVHPAWIGLSAFIGAGLTFAGITDTCGMGMLIARMPWN